MLTPEQVEQIIRTERRSAFLHGRHSERQAAHLDRTALDVTDRRTTLPEALSLLHVLEARSRERARQDESGVPYGGTWPRLPPEPGEDGILVLPDGRRCVVLPPCGHRDCLLVDGMRENCEREPR